jgi:hypothetical protein
LIGGKNEASYSTHLVLLNLRSLSSGLVLFVETVVDGIEAFGCGCPIRTCDLVDLRSSLAPPQREPSNERARNLKGQI